MKTILLTFWSILLYPVVIANPKISCSKQKICEIQNLTYQDGNQPLNLTLGRNFVSYPYIKIINSHIVRIPLVLVSAFPHLKSFSAVDCGLEVIETDAIGSKLHHLILSNNRITVLEDKTFKMASELRTIDLSRNIISVVAGLVFQFLVNLNTLDLSYNRIATLENVTFAHLTRLVTLKLGHNLMQAIEPELFRENRALTTLELQNNKVQMLPDHLFDGLDKLQIINFGKNQIDEIQPEAFMGLVTTNMINLSENHLQKLENVKFSGTIGHLDLNNNRIVTIDLDRFRNSVLDLQLHSNRIQHFNATQYNSKMTILNLAHNQLTAVNGIRKLRQLEIVNLSSNPELGLRPSDIVGLQSLKALFLKNVGLTNLTGAKKWFENLSSLEELDLSFNNLERVDIGAIASLQNLLKFNLESTNITEIKGYDRISMSFPKLLGLMLLGNDITCRYLDQLVDSLERPDIVFAGKCRHLEELMSTKVEEVISTMQTEDTSTVEVTTLEDTVQNITEQEMTVLEATEEEFTVMIDDFILNCVQPVVTSSGLVSIKIFLSVLILLYNFQRK